MLPELRCRQRTTESRGHNDDDDDPPVLLPLGGRRIAHIPPPTDTEGARGKSELGMDNRQIPQVLWEQRKSSSATCSIAAIIEQRWRVVFIIFDSDFLSPVTRTARHQPGAHMTGSCDGDKIKGGRARTQTQVLSQQRATGVLAMLGPIEGGRVPCVLIAE